jgi:glycosyltransferase involved in cell wall biosynthesis
MNEMDGMLVSVVIPCFNVRSFVGRTLQSLLAQDHADWEAILVDDGSTDGTDAVITACTDPRLRLVRQANQGVSAARNRGIDLASGRALLFLDADDWLAPEALARMVARLDGSAAIATYGPFCFVTEDGSRVVQTKAGPFPEGDIIERLLVENLFANGGHMLIRTQAIAAIGRFRADLRFGEDWEYWCRLALHGALSVVPGQAPLLFVRQRSSGAYLRMATNPEAFTPCIQAIFGNPDLIRRVDPVLLARLHRATEAETDWIVGRELIRHGSVGSGLARLRRSAKRRFSIKRAVLLVVAHLSPVLPTRLTGPFRRYRTP